jgi:FkbM family methyltransferase
VNTKTKIGFAKLIYKGLRLLGFSQKRVITRSGVTFDVDLAEGIDLSLFLFGSFQKWVIDDSLLPQKENFCAIDIGANIGAICLPLASRNSSARIIAVEATDSAYNRLLRNISLNLALQPRIEAIRAFMGDGSGTAAGQVAYPSWRLDKTNGVRHEVHLGEAHQVTSPMLSIDELVRSKGLSHLDFIKIDTDGHEMAILKGGRETIQRLRPLIVFEFCFYENEKRGLGFEDFASFFREMGYTLCLCDKNTRVEDEATARKYVPELGSCDFAAVPG